MTTVDGTGIFQHRLYFSKFCSHTTERELGEKSSLFEIEYVHNKPSSSFLMRGSCAMGSNCMNN